MTMYVLGNIYVLYLSLHTYSKFNTLHYSQPSLEVTEAVVVAGSVGGSIQYISVKYTTVAVNCIFQIHIVVLVLQIIW